jgi:NTP pyrophosphatase (non-canonical NTP hydrolase)
MRCNLRELYQQSVDVIDNFRRIEPRPWDERILAIELCGEVGSLTHALLDTEGYKRRPPNLPAVKNECADVLFIVLRLAGYCGFLLPDTAQPLPARGAEHPLALEDVGLELSRLAGEVAAHAIGQVVISVETLLRMAALVEAVAEHYRFSLRDAYLSELDICRRWQAKNLTSSRWRQRLLGWLEKGG